MAVALRTPRLLLREWRDDDLAPFIALAADPLTMQYLPTLDAETAGQWVALVRDHWAVEGFGQ